MRIGGGLQEASWANGSRLLVRRGLTGVTGNLYYGFHEFVEMSFVAMLLRPDDLFFDVGANAGTYTVLASKVAGANTIAFEPGENAAEVFAQTVALNGIQSRVLLRREAVADRAGIARFTRGLGTMNKLSEVGDISVPLVTVDAVASEAAPIAIKLDIEGGEEAGIAGAMHTLASPHLQALIIETVSETAAEAIAGAGLTEAHFDPWTRELYDGMPRLPANNRIFLRDRAFVAERLRSAPTIKVAGLEL